MGVQVTISAVAIDKQRLGYHALSLTNFAVGNTAEPSIAAGSKVEIGGALYEFTGDETCTGWAGLTASAIAYILLTPSGATVAGSYTNTAPTWDSARQGWYTGSNRVVAMLYKDAASLYQFKNIIPPGQDVLEFFASITSTVNPFLFNLPAATGTGRRIRIVDTSIVSTGLVQIAPAGTDLIGSAGNVSCFLQNVDQSTYVYKFQFLDLADSRAGYWTVLGGQLCPDQAVDTDGQQYHLGKLHHLPLGNTTSRQLFNAAPPAAAAYSAAITGTGVGVPTAVKAIRVRVEYLLAATAAGGTVFRMSLTDNNGNTPTFTSAHPMVAASWTAAAASSLFAGAVEIDLPLNSSGQFYLYTITTTNINVAFQIIMISAVGYYMGD